VLLRVCVHDYYSTNIGELALSSVVLADAAKTVILGSWDNKLYAYSIGYGRVTSVTAHDEAVSCLWYLPPSGSVRSALPRSALSCVLCGVMWCSLRGDRLISGSWDATVKVWNCRDGDISKRPLIGMPSPSLYLLLRLLLCPTLTVACVARRFRLHRS
jgi:WD40 repeat protein